jgi:nucleoside-diphosphate-sugar epimerase
MKVLVTGASGFVGSKLIVELRQQGQAVTAASRSRIEQPGIVYVRSPELGSNADWSEALTGIEVVVHLAGLAHIRPGKNQREAGQKYLRINTEGSARLVEQCLTAGVKHFVFLSSCHAVASESGELLTDRTVPHPVTDYGRSKLAAEGAIKSILAGSGCSWTILRLPLVYGPGNRANFGLLVKLVKMRIPLPLATVRNRRSFIYVENLADLVATCLGNPAAFGKTFYPSDGEDLSTAELIEKIAGAEARTAGRMAADGSPQRPNLSRRQSRTSPKFSGFDCSTTHARLFSFPEDMLKALGRLPGLGALRKLISSLYVDSEPTRRELGWMPRFTMNEGLRRTLVKRP